MRVLMLTDDDVGSAAAGEPPRVKNQAECVRLAGIDVEIYTPTSLRLRHFWRMRRDLRRFLKKQHFDVVHAQFAQGGALTRGIWGGPLVVTINNSDVTPTLSRPVSFVRRFLWRRLCLFAASTCDEAVVENAGLPQQLPHRPYHVLGQGQVTPAAKPSATELIGIYQLARATHAAMQ